MHGRVGGLAEAAGKVRKGKPSGPGQHTHPSRTTPAPARGTANLNRCAETAAPSTDGQGELGAEAREGQQADRTLGKVWTNLEQNQDATNDRNDAENHRKSSRNSSREGPQDSPSRSRHPPRAPSSEEKPHVTQQMPKKSRKSAPSRPKVAPKRPFWDPGGTPKSTKIEPGTLPEHPRAKKKHM